MRRLLFLSRCDDRRYDHCFTCRGLPALFCWRQRQAYDDFDHSLLHPYLSRRDGLHLLEFRRYALAPESSQAVPFLGLAHLGDSIQLRAGSWSGGAHSV